MRNELPVSKAGLWLIMAFFIVLSGKPAVADPVSGGESAVMHEGSHEGRHARHGFDKFQEFHGHKDGGHQHGMQTHGFDPYKKFLMCKTKLNLTPEQIKEIGNQRFEYKKQMIRNAADREIARLEFHKLLTADALDEQRLGDAAKEIGNLVAKQIAAAMDAKIAVIKLLTPEQRKKYGESHFDH